MSGFARVSIELSKAVPLLQHVWFVRVSTELSNAVLLLQYVWVRACFYRAFQGGSTITICLGSCVFLLSFQRRFLCCNMSDFVRVSTELLRRFLCCNMSRFVRASTKLSKAVPLLQYV